MPHAFQPSAMPPNTDTTINFQVAKGLITQIPIKLLRSLAARIVSGLLRPVDGDVDCNDSLDSACTLRMGNQQRDFSLSEDDVSTCSDSIANEFPFLDSSMSTSSFSSTTDEAARADDAESNPEDWDVWAVEHFAPPIGVTPVICCGRYINTQH